MPHSTLPDPRQAGISLAHVARLAGIPYMRLYRAFNGGGYQSLTSEERDSLVATLHRLNLGELIG